MDRAEERENAKAKIKDEVLQMVLLDKATDQRKNKGRKWEMEEDDSDSEEEEAARKWGRQMRGPQRPPPAAQDGRSKKGSERNKGWMRTPPQTRSRTATRCFQCGQLGHWKRNCPQRGRLGVQQEGGSRQLHDRESY